MKHVTEEQLAEQRKRVLARDESIFNASFLLRRAGLTYREIADRLGVHPKTAQIRADDDSQDVDAGCVHCPTCGEDVPVDEWRIITWDDEATGFSPWPIGAAVHGCCVTKPYREPWWLRALRAIKKWSES